MSVTAIDNKVLRTESRYVVDLHELLEEVKKLSLAWYVESICIKNGHIEVALTTPANDPYARSRTTDAGV